MPKKSLNILFADDEDEIASIVASILKRAGHTVDVVGDGQAALLKLKEAPGHYHLLITDSNMPELSGIELIARLTETGFKGKVILLTGYLTEEMEGTYVSLLIDKVIQKPFPLAEFSRQVDELGAACDLPGRA